MDISNIFSWMYFSFGQRKLKVNGKVPIVREIRSTEVSNTKFRVAQKQEKNIIQKNKSVIINLKRRLE